MPSVEKYIKKNSGDVDSAKDVFHDALLNLIMKIKKGDTDIKDIKGYLFTASKNLWITKKRRDTKVSFTDEIIDRQNADEYESSQMLEDKEKSSMMDEMLTALGKRCKELLTLTFYLDYSLKEAAERLGFSSDEVAKTTQYRCKKKLFELVKNNKVFMEEYH